MSLLNISPVDGRYCQKTSVLADYFSEYALIRYRVYVEIEYFIALCELSLKETSGFDKSKYKLLRDIYNSFSLKDAENIKAIEQTTNHDVKAVEYFIKEKFELLGISSYKEFIHFGLTSQDINNTSIPYSIKAFMEDVYFEKLSLLQNKLQSLAKEWEAIPLLARTHGQVASPTRLGKEIAVFSERLNQQIDTLKQIPYAAKFGGATGNFNAHNVAYPKIDWYVFSKQFIEKTLKLHYSFPTTQIEHYDFMASLFDNVKRINTILIDLNRDMWMYISMDFFKQKIAKKEVGSSTMPHKVNPIDFENSEGNLGLANALLEFLARKLPVSRLQRDLTDSTVMRNIGVPFAHSIIAMDSTLKGLNKLLLNKKAIDKDLENNWEVVTEGIQTILRREGHPNPYETLKKLTRKHTKINQKSILEFINELDVSSVVKNEMKKITPMTYTGI